MKEFLKLIEEARKNAFGDEFFFVSQLKNENSILDYRNQILIFCNPMKKLFIDWSDIKDEAERKLIESFSVSNGLIVTTEIKGITVFDIEVEKYFLSPLFNFTEPTHIIRLSTMRSLCEEWKINKLNPNRTTSTFNSHEEIRPVIKSIGNVCEKCRLINKTEINKKFLI